MVRRVREGGEAMKYDNKWAFFLGSLFGVLLHFAVSTAMGMAVSA